MFNSSLLYMISDVTPRRCVRVIGGSLPSRHYVYTFTVFRLGRTAPHFRPNEGAGGGKAGYIRDLNSLRRVYPPIWRPAAGVGVRWPIRWLHWGLAVSVSGLTLLWPKNHGVYPLLAVGLDVFRFFRKQVRFFFKQVQYFFRRHWSTKV